MGQKYGEAKRNKNKEKPICCKTTICRKMKGKESLRGKNKAK
jgi:hypothetical protein